MVSKSASQIEHLPGNRVAGTCIHFSSLPSPLGIGDIGDAAIDFIDLIARTKLTVWQVLPVGPTSFGDSPYQTLSTFAGNEMLIGLEPLVRQGLLEDRDLSALQVLPASTVRFESLVPVKRNLLDKAAHCFLDRASKAELNRFRSFCDANARQWLDDYALYRVLKSRHDEKAWTDWAPELATRDRTSIELARLDLAPELETVRVIQFFFDLQWTRLREHASRNGIRLLGDIPFYIAHDSADAWANPELLMMDANGKPSQVSGVPPDYFSEDGQLWGNPVYDWAQHANDGYKWWIGRLAHAAGLHDLIRIDHFRGFESYWSVPFGETTARNGAWMPGPGNEFFATARKSLGKLPVIAEDLGLITPAVTRLRKRQGFPGMKVLQFELLDPDFDVTKIPADCVCYTGTHDNDTARGWFTGKGVEKRRSREIRQLQRRALKQTGGTARTIHLDLIRLAFSTRAGMAIVPFQDFLGLGSEARMNTPGTAQGNWRWRLGEEQVSPALVRQISGLVEGFSRR